MFSIFNTKKPNSSIPNVSTARTADLRCEEDVDNPGLLVISNQVNNLDLDSDLGDFDSGPRRPILKVCNVLLFIKIIIYNYTQYWHFIFSFNFNATCKLLSSLNLDD